MKKILFLLVAGFILSACNEDPNKEPENPQGPDRQPGVSVTAGTATENSLTFTISPEDADLCTYLCVEKSDAPVPSAEDIFKTGQAADAAKPSEKTVTDLNPSTEYLIVAAVSAEDKFVRSEPVYMKTPDFVFSSASAEVSSYSADITFRDQKDRYQMGASFVAAIGKTGYLPAGTYQLKSSITDDDEMVIDVDSEYSYVTSLSDHKSHKMTEGTVNVKITDTKEYQFEIDVKLDNGKRFSARYEGMVDGISVVYQIQIAEAVVRSVNNYVPGEFYTFLHDADWTYELYIDFYSDPASDMLAEGNYKFAEDKSALTFGPQSNIQIYEPYSSAYITEGNVEVSKTGNEYTLALHLVTDAGREIAGTYKGVIATPVPELLINNPMMSDDELTFQIIPMDAVKCAYLILTADESVPMAEEILSEGTEVAFDDASDVMVKNLDPQSSYKIAAAAKAIGGATKVVTADVQKEAHTFLTAEAPDGLRSYYVDLVFTDKDNKTTLKAELCADMAKFGYLPAGEYPLMHENEGDDPYLNLDYSYVQTSDGGQFYINAGKVIVNITENNEYEFLFDLTLSSGALLNSSYKGEVKGMPIVFPLEIAKMKYSTLNDAVPGEFYIKVNDYDYKYEMYIDFFSSAEAEELEVGTYSFSDSQSPFTFGPRSSISFYSPNANFNITAGTIEVAKSGNDYTVTFDLVAENGRSLVGTYTGKIF